VTHLTPEQLGDVDAVAGHEHLRTCQRCRELWQEQRGVRDLLRGLPDPGGMPPDVAAGLAQALGSLSPDDVERPADGQEPADGADRGDHVHDAGTAGSTVVPLHPPTGRRDRGRRATPWLAAAAAVVVLGGGGAALVSQPWNGADSQTSADSSAGSEGPREGASGGARAAASHVRSTGTAYERATLPAQVRSELLSPAAPTGSGASGPALSDDGATATGDVRLASPDALASCLSALGVDAGQVTAVDLARFEGEPAALVIVGDPGGAHDVWVVGRGCRQGDDQTRYFVRVP
jgi:hypothetical protein